MREYVVVCVKCMFIVLSPRCNAIDASSVLNAFLLYWNISIGYLNNSKSCQLLMCEWSDDSDCCHKVLTVTSTVALFKSAVSKKMCFVIFWGIKLFYVKKKFILIITVRRALLLYICYFSLYFIVYGPQFNDNIIILTLVLIIYFETAYSNSC